MNQLSLYFTATRERLEAQIVDLRRRAEKAEAVLQSVDDAISDRGVPERDCTLPMQDRVSNIIGELKEWRHQYGEAELRAEKAEAEVERLTGLLDDATSTAATQADDIDDLRARLAAAEQQLAEASKGAREGESEQRPSMIQLPYDALEDDWRAATVRALDTLDDRLEALEHAKEAGRSSRARTELEAVRDLIDRGASSADTWNHIDARIAELRAQEAGRG